MFVDEIAPGLGRAGRGASVTGVPRGHAVGGEDVQAGVRLGSALQARTKQEPPALDDGRLCHSRAQSANNIVRLRVALGPLRLPDRD